MSTTVSFILAMSCGIPALLGLIKLSRVAVNYHPFIWLMIVAFITELITDIPILLYENYSLMRFTYPWYFIIEVFLLLLFFKRNEVLIQNILLYGVPLLGIILYLVSYYYTHTFQNSAENYCTIFFTAILIIFSIKLLSNEIFETKILPFKNPKIIIAFGCIMFYSFDLLEKAFSLSTSHNGLNFFLIHQVANVLSYLIFTWAIIWIPRKTKY